MKRVSIFLTPILLFALLFLTLHYTKVYSLALAITLGVFAILFLSYFYFEKSRMGTKEIAIIATLSVFAAVSRVPFAVLMNVQPTTFLVALSGLVFGAYPGFLVGSTAAFISNLFMGQGPHTPWQMLAWGIVGMLSGWIGKRERKIATEKFALLCFAYGFLFDWIMNLWHVLIFIQPLALKPVLLAYLTGITADVLHAVGNFIFAMVFYDPFYKVLFRFKKRLEISYEIHREENKF